MNLEIQTLSQLFKDHSAVLLELGDSLRRQKEAIIHWDLPALTHEQRIHNQLLVRIRVFESARKSSLEDLSRKLGLNGRASPNEILAQIANPTGSEVRDSFANLLAIAGSVRELYLENKKYLAHSIEGIELSLSVLRSAKQLGGTYSKNSSGAQLSDDHADSRFVSQSI